MIGRRGSVDGPSGWRLARPAPAQDVRHTGAAAGGRPSDAQTLGGGPHTGAGVVRPSGIRENSGRHHPRAPSCPRRRQAGA